MKKTPTIRAIRRHARPLLAGLALGLALVWAQNALANPQTTPGQPIDLPMKTLRAQGLACDRAIAAQERRQAIPRGLLQAIAQVESGRWDAQNKENFAWPWTVTTGGKGYYLPNRVDAVAFVQSLRADGVENIDVGCLQINLKYHPGAFATLEQAFDPTANAAYAARFLKERYGETKSWLGAAGQYHSTTPDLNQAYQDKVAQLWQGGANVQPAAQANRMTASNYAPPDTDRTQSFNQAFRARRSGSVVAASGAAVANRYLALQPGAPLDNSSDFAAKRQAQLLAWRRDQGFAPR